jgi:hypothetical protein
MVYKCDHYCDTCYTQQSKRNLHSSNEEAGGEEAHVRLQDIVDSLPEAVRELQQADWLLSWAGDHGNLNPKVNKHPIKLHSMARVVFGISDTTHTTTPGT